MKVIIIDYGDDTERKRIDYVLDKWKVCKSKGMTIKLEEIDNNFLKELYSKLIRGYIEVYECQPIDTEPEKASKSLIIAFDKELREVEQLLNFIFSKQAGILKDSSRFKEFSEMVFAVYTRQGGVEVKLVLQPYETQTKVEVTMKGFEEAIDTLKNDLIQDLKYFKVKIGG
ncbi:MAG: hypothetical protein ACE5KE_14380 [Methanosarcinales archaeon]